MNETTIALITGANKGLGLETTRRLAALGWTVLMGSRDAQRGAAAAAGVEGDVVALPLDVTSDESVTAAVKEVEQRYGRLDVLISNAGIAGRQIALLDTTVADMEHVFATNVFAPVRVTNAFVPLLRRSTAPRIVMVSSGLGSITRTAEAGRIENSIQSLTYTGSKAALNMLTSQYARALPEFRVNVADPGFTATDLNGNRGTQTVTEGTDAIVTLATVAPDGPTGTFIDRAGPVAW